MKMGKLVSIMAIPDCGVENLAKYHSNDVQEARKHVKR